MPITGNMSPIQGKPTTSAIDVNTMYLCIMSTNLIAISERKK